MRMRVSCGLQVEIKLRLADKDAHATLASTLDPPQVKSVTACSTPSLLFTHLHIYSGFRHL